MIPAEQNVPVPSAAAWAELCGNALAQAAEHFLLTFRSEHTRRNYERDLREFLAWAKEQGQLLNAFSDITETLALRWQAALHAHHTRHGDARGRVVQTTVARKLSTLSSFLGFAQKRRFTDANPLALLQRPRIRRESRTNALTLEEAQRLLSYLELRCTEAAADAESGGMRSLAYRSARLRFAVVFTLLTVGMRVDELCELRLGDFERTPQWARLHMTAKGAESHSPILHDDTTRVLVSYIEEFRAHAEPAEHLFVRAQKVRKSGKLSQAAVFQMITESALAMGIDKRLSPHSCRATVATLLHNQGVPIGQIQDLLNHKQITTTAIYIKKAQELEEAAARKLKLFTPELPPKP